MILTRVLRQTVQWYLDNEAWWRPLVDRGDALRRLGEARPARDTRRLRRDAEM